MGKITMMKRLVLASAAACYCIATPQAFAETVVFVVSYHNLDYAKNACDRVLSMEPDAVKTMRAVRDIQRFDRGYVNDDTANNILAGAVECRSVRDTRELGRRLENELIDALAVEPLCAGITMIRDPHRDFDGGGFSKENDAIKQEKPYWDLHLDYQPGSKVFGWTMFPNKAGMKLEGSLVNGEGTASKAAKQICIVASGRGATIR
jgi:hypothetical protein